MKMFYISTLSIAYLISIITTTFIILFGVIIITESASSSQSQMYNPYQYDLTIPQFTPDGRLLQVEYAQKASMDHSIPIIVATICTNNKETSENSNEIVPTINTGTDTDDEHITIFIACHRSKMGQQSRLITIPTQITTIIHPLLQQQQSVNHNHMNDKIVIAISGILSDALAILQIIQSFRIQEYRTMGDISSSTSGTTITRRIAYQIASQCQSRTISGGKRPYGATIWIMSTRPSYMYQPILHQIDPSGAIHDIILPSTTAPTNHVNDVDNFVTVLGGGIMGTTIQRRIQNEWNGNTTTAKAIQMNHPISTNTFIQKRIGHLLSITIDEYRNRYNLKKDFKDNDNNYNPSSLFSNINNDNDNKIQPNSETKSGTATNDSDSEDCIDHLEVLLISSKRGTLKLSSDQIRSFIRRTHQ
jgi:Proteasome subunit A N-terminal signature/Proteasome subunit